MTKIVASAAEFFVTWCVLNIWMLFLLAKSLLVNSFACEIRSFALHVTSKIEGDYLIHFFLY